MILISHPTGNEFARNAALALQEAGLLYEFWTAVAPNAHWFTNILSQLPGLSELTRRNVPRTVTKYTRQRPLREALRVGAERSGLGRSGLAEMLGLSVDAVYRDLDTHVASTLMHAAARIRGVYAFEDGALLSFRRAAKLGMQRIYDLPIGYWRVSRTIAREEAERLPGWRGTLPALNDSAGKLNDKDEELQLATSVMVASSYTAETLRQVPFAVPPPIVITYGCGTTPILHQSTARKAQPRGSPLRVLFVGSLTQRKGLFETFRAVDALGGRATLTLIGQRVGESRERDQQLSKHRWISTLPHDGILRQMQEHDVLLFPSLFEGFGLVITEALSQGLPVITTAHTCGPDILTEGEDGFVVPIRDWEASAVKLETLYNDRERLAGMRRKSLEKAKSHTWAVYRAMLASSTGATVA